MSMDKEILMRFISEQGYKKNSPDKDRPMNIIPSGNITMKDVEFPVFGVDNLGNSQMMYPGTDYQFPGNMVMELPMKQNAGMVNPPAPVGGRQYVGRYNLQGEFIPYNYRYASYTENPDIQDEQGNTGYFAQFSKPVGSKTDFGNYKFAATESDSAYYESNPAEGITTIFIAEGEDDPYASNPMWQQSSYQEDAKIKEKFDKRLSKLQQGGMTVSQTWEQKTGTPWSEAKAQGYTTGSYQDNIDLLNRLNSGEFDQTPTVSNDTSGVVTVPDTATEEVNFDNHVDFASAFKDARNQFGSNHIFTYQGKRYTTNTASEPFTPNKDQISDEQNRTGNSEVRVRKNLDLQAKKAGSPYHSKNDLDTETKVWEDWNTVKSDQLETNKMGNADVIVEYHKNNPSDKNFVIVDKDKGLMHMYKPDGTLLFTDAFDIDVGANPGDAQTVTKYKDLNGNGITDPEEMKKNNVDWGAGNMSTGAGKYYISNIDPKGYGGLPLLNMMNENQYSEYLKTGNVNQVSTSFHKGYVADDNNRVSNGCIRCNRPTLDALTSNLQNTSEVYILPEDKGNRFVIENNKLNFRVGSGKDYEQYTDSEGNVQSGQGINRTTETLNYIPIKINIDQNALQERSNKDTNQGGWSGGWDQNQYRKRVQPFVTSLQTNKQEIMKAAQISGDIYNDLVGITLGIFGTETNYGDQHAWYENLGRAGKKWWNPDSSSPDYQSKYETYGADEESNSVGLTQIRWGQLNDHEKEVLAELGITSNEDFLDPALSAKATIAILGVRYNEQLTAEEKQDPWTHLPGKWNNRGNYADRVKTNASFFNVQQVTPEGEVILKDLNENRKKVLSKMDPIYPEVNQTVSTRDIQKPVVEEYLTPAERKTKYINTLSKRFGIPPSQVTDQMIDKYLASIGLTRDMVEKERGGTVDPTEVFDEEMKLDKKFKPGGLTYDKTKAIYETRKLLSLLT